MGDLDRAGADREQPAVGEDVEDAGDALAALRVEIGKRDAPANDRAVLALAREARAGALRAISCSAGSKRRNASSASRATAPWTPPVPR